MTDRQPTHGPAWLIFGTHEDGTGTSHTAQRSRRRTRVRRSMAIRVVPSGGGGGRTLRQEGARDESVERCASIRLRQRANGPATPRAHAVQGSDPQPIGTARTRRADARSRKARSEVSRGVDSIVMPPWRLVVAARIGAREERFDGSGFRCHLRGSVPTAFVAGDVVGSSRGRRPDVLFRRRRGPVRRVRSRRAIPLGGVMTVLHSLFRVDGVPIDLAPCAGPG